MSELEELKKQRDELSQKLQELQVKSIGIVEEIEGLEEDLYRVRESIRFYTKNNLKEGFTEWKKGINEEDIAKRNAPFELTDEQYLKVAYLSEVFGSEYGGAIGGGVTYKFTPTSIGVIVSVKIAGVEYDLTGYSGF